MKFCKLSNNWIINLEKVSSIHKVYKEDWDKNKTWGIAVHYDCGEVENIFIENEEASTEENIDVLINYILSETKSK